MLEMNTRMRTVKINHSVRMRFACISLSSSPSFL